MQFSREIVEKTITKICEENLNGAVPNQEQIEAVYQIVNGKNICILGPPGTGKTFTSNLIDLVLMRLKPKVTFSRTATTGMASSHISTRNGEEGKTFYRWVSSGSESMIAHDVRFLDKLRTDNRCRRAILNTSILQIDETSMMNMTTLSYLNDAAREVRGNRKYMGNIQLILTGDIHQLGTIDVSPGGGHERDATPIPIPSILDNLPDNIDVVILKTMMRSTDPLHQVVLKGIVSPDEKVRSLAIQILNKKCCKEELNPWDAVQLAFKEGSTIVTYANSTVDLYNKLEGVLLQQINPEGPIEISRAKKLHSWETLPKDGRTYLKDEDGMKREEQELIKRRSFQMNLALYPNQNVLLRRNNEEYKNGQVVRFEGVVEKEEKTLLIIRRLCDDKILYLDLISHTSEYVPELGFEQYPIIPNAAVTTHKVQGSTLENVIFDPAHIDLAGKDISRLLYTCVSRTKNLASFRLTSPIKVSLITHPCVQAALEKIWKLDYMKEYPSITYEEISEIARPILSS